MLSENELTGNQSEETPYERFSNEFLTNACDVTSRFVDRRGIPDRELKIFLIKNRMLPEWGTELLWDVFVRSMEIAVQHKVKDRRELGRILLSQISNSGLCVLQDRALYENDSFYHESVREREMRNRTVSPMDTGYWSNNRRRVSFDPQDIEGLRRAFMDPTTGRIRGEDEPEG